MTVQGVICKGACYQLFNGKPCYLCHQIHGPDETGCAYALDLANAQCAHFTCLALTTNKVLQDIEYLSLVSTEGVMMRMLLR